MASNNIQPQSATTGKAKGIKKERPDQMPLARRNFIMMAIAGVLIVAGFLLMLGDSSSLENFNPDIFSTRRIVIGPLMTFAGFIFMGVAIILRPRSKNDSNAENTL